MAASEAVAVAAPAKINLYLHVTGKRADGFHLLDSLIAFADIHDTLIAEPGPSLVLRLKGPFAGALEAENDNLVLRAARALADAADMEPAAKITLIKRLPVAAGIGGGSADAAAAIRALCRLWDIAPTDGHLQEIALSLGADVPVCLRGRAAQVSGVGEVFAPAPDLPAATIVLANPGVPVSTPAVFRARRGAFSMPQPLTGAPTTAIALAEALRERSNDLAEPALHVAPVIGDCLEALGATSGCLLARMSGSGATCFGLFDSDRAAVEAAGTLQREREDWWVRAGRLLDATGGLAPDETEA